MDDPQQQKPPPEPTLRHWDSRTTITTKYIWSGARGDDPGFDVNLKRLLRAGIPIYEASWLTYSASTTPMQAYIAWNSAEKVLFWAEIDDAEMQLQGFDEFKDLVIRDWAGYKWKLYKQAIIHERY